MPFAVESGHFVVVIDARFDVRWLCREVAVLLAPIRATVVDTRPGWMRPGDYVECRIGPMDWLEGRSGWSNVLVGELTPRYTPQVVHALVPDDRIVAHEVAHTLLGFDHNQNPNNLMHDPPGTEWTNAQRRLAWDRKEKYVGVTKGTQFRWRRQPGWTIETLSSV